MKLLPKWVLIFSLLFAAGNIFIFINRNRKFEYVKYSGMDELYPYEASTSFLNKWNKNNQLFTTAELEQGKSVIKKQTGADTVSDETTKVIKIASWLYKFFNQQQGIPETQLSMLTPFQQYNYLIAHKEKKLWCGHFQRMFGFFCTVAGLQNRYVEIVPIKDSANVGYHEVNEVYLPATKKWVMVDITRNLFLISKNDQALSAAQYFDYRVKEQPVALLITSFDSTTVISKLMPKENFSTDIYFNKNYFLRYYINFNLSEVYSPIQKFQKYIFPKPWYEIYSPGSSGTNFFFRIKQFFFFGLLVLMIMMLFYLVKNKWRQSGLKK